MKKAKVVFLDRDGVINRDRGSEYINSWGKFRFIPGSLKALRLLKEGGYKVVVVSNQAGVAKGFYSLKELRAVTERIKQAVKTSGGQLDAVYYCPHRREDRCRCRKPKTGLFRKAKRRFGVQLNKAFMVGDSLVDITAGRNLHCKTILVLSGRERLSRRRVWEVQPDTIKKNLLEAVQWILRQDDQP